MSTGNRRRYDSGPSVPLPSAPSSSVPSPSVLSPSVQTPDARRRPRVLVITEGTYPFIVGGVSTWCDSLVTGLRDVDFRVLPITAGGVRRDVCFTIPDNTRLAGHLDLWSEDVPLSVPRHSLSPLHNRIEYDLPSALARGLLGWDSDLDEFVNALLRCQRHPRRIRAAFRSRRSWNAFVDTLDALTKHSANDHLSAPGFDMFEVAELYRLLWWIARCAAYPTPSADDAPDLCMVTAAGWAAIPAVVHKALHGTPILLTEHGIYVREAYLAAIRNDASPASRWTASRVARGLSRLAYNFADRISPVTEANAAWEEEFGVPRAKISTIYNGVVVPSRREPAPGTSTVVAVGRIDPLKDIKTMLRTAARVVESHPEARFIHYGPTPAENRKYASECEALHAELGLGSHFVFAGPTEDPYGVVARADIALLTSMSEGSPITVLEAMASGRPVVATAVGGVPEAVRGCGFTARPGDHQALAAGIVRLLDNPEFSESLGRLAYARAAEVFGHSSSLANYRDVIGELTGFSARPDDYPRNPPPAPLARSEAVLNVEPEVGDHTAGPGTPATPRIGGSPR